jgi:uncharacterized delta-60 repeat protein
MKKTLLLICLLSLAVAPVAAAKPAGKSGAGQLDRSFGREGKATVAFPAESGESLGVKYEVPFQFVPGHLQMATAPDGKIVIAGSTQLVRLLPNGKLDPSFGSGGVVAVDRPAGQSFLLADVAVDQQGRVLLAGSVRPQPTSSTPDPLISSAMVRRYNSDGSLDPSFGSGGTVITDFGLQPPQIGPTRYSGPAVGLRSVVVDSEGRPVLTGGSVTEVIGCNGSAFDHAVNTAFVARLSTSGALDPSFGSGGLRQIADFGSFAQDHLFPSGNLLAVASTKYSCSGGSGYPVVLTSFDTAGNLASNFGFSGFRSLNFRRAPVVALAPSGKILLLGAQQKIAKSHAQQLVMRLLPSGAKDPGFGRIGQIFVVTPRSVAFSAIAADGRERVLLAGRATHKLPRGNGLRRATFLLSRLKPKGTFDRSFGRRGSVKTGFGGPADSRATQVAVDTHGRILVGGPISTPRLSTGGGFAVARYLSGR